jgi:hypothetical protein
LVLEISQLAQLDSENTEPTPRDVATSIQGLAARPLANSGQRAQEFDFGNWELRQVIQVLDRAVPDVPVEELSRGNRCALRHGVPHLLKVSSRY